jgi:hypothetical protein
MVSKEDTKFFYVSIMSCDVCRCCTVHYFYVDVCALIILRWRLRSVHYALQCDISRAIVESLDCIEIL